MNKKIIELELRAEITKDQESLKKRLLNLGFLHSRTKRLSVMYFGSIGEKKIDVRVRATNGECEVVVKSGAFGSHDRTEIAQHISPDQFLGMVKIFAQLDFVMEVGERETLNYELPGDVVVSLVSAGPIAYIELEKMSSQSDLQQNSEQLKEISKQLELQLLPSEEEFDALCKRLSGNVDWQFHGTNEEYEKLTELVHRYTN